MLNRELDQRCDGGARRHPFERHEGTLKALLRLGDSPNSNLPTGAGDAEVRKLHDDAIRAATGYCRYFGFTPYRERATDAVQEWFCKLLRPQAGRWLDPSRPIFPWAYTALFYITLGMARHEARHGTQLAKLAEAEQTGDPLTSAILGELDEAVRELPKMYFEAIFLRVYRGLSAREAARELGIAASTVDVHVYRGLAKLRLCWRDKI